MMVRRTGTQRTRRGPGRGDPPGGAVSLPGWCAPSGPADQGDLSALRDQPARAVPDLGFLVEPAAADVPAPGRDPELAGGRDGPHVPGQLDRGRPADHLD